MDEITQWQVVGAAEQISGAWLMPVLEAMLEQFPFPVRGFHSDNGSEFINHRVAELLNNLLAEQTKSRPRHSNDNGLAESKNGAVVRKHMGYGHIRAIHAEAINEFYREHFKPYLNFHRPCGVPEVVTGAKGKQRRIYRWYATPWEIPRQLPDLARYLKPDCTVEDEPESRKRERYVERWTDAERKTEAVRHFRAQADRMKTRPTEGRGNDGLWNTRKTNAGFPTFPTPLEIAKARFPHPHSPGYDREEKWKFKNRIPTFPSRLLVLSQKKERRFPERQVLRRSGSLFDWNMLCSAPYANPTQLRKG